MLSIRRALSLLVFYSCLASRAAVADVEQFCTNDYLRSCDSLATNECLTKFYACGQYNAIIEHFSAEQSPDAAAHYFKGTSYYGLSMRNRAASLRCQFTKLAKSELATFLYQVRDSGASNPIDFDRIYQAAKIIGELKKIGGCLELGISEDEIRFFVQDYANNRLESLFIGSSKTDGLGQQIDAMKSNIQTTIGSFMTSASQIETQFDLREVAMVASQRRLAEIAEVFERSMGSAETTKNADGDVSSLTLSLDISRGFLLADKNAAAWREKVASIEKNLIAAFDGRDVNAYEKARANFSIRGRYVRDEANVNVQFISNLTDNSALGYFKSLQGSASDASNPLTAIAAMEKKLREGNSGAADCVFFEVKAPWFCESSDTTFNPMPSR
jgi:hypothetical protein